MDYTQVVPRFKKWACLLQVALVSVLSAYLIYQMAEIIAFAENPPVDIKMQKWDGAGRWALCSWFGNRLNGAGVAIANQTGVVSHHHPDWNASSLSGLPLFPTELEIEDYKRNCTSVDLNNWEWPEHETFFSCAADSTTKFMFGLQVLGKTSGMRNLHL